MPPVYDELFGRYVELYQRLNSSPAAVVTA